MPSLRFLQLPHLLIFINIANMATGEAKTMLEAHKVVAHGIFSR